MKKLILATAFSTTLLFGIACGGESIDETVDQVIDAVATPVPSATTVTPEPAATSRPEAVATPAPDVPPTPIPILAVEPTADEFLAFSLRNLTGTAIIEAEINQDGISITYEQSTDATEADLLNQWLNMAMVAMTFLDEPRSVTIIPITEGVAVGQIVVPAGVLGEVLTGERSIQQAIAAIEVLE